MKKISIITVQIAGALLALDAFGFMAWVMSGQHPVDGFYLGTVTAHILRAVLGL